MFPNWKSQNILFRTKSRSRGRRAEEVEGGRRGRMKCMHGRVSNPVTTAQILKVVRNSYVLSNHSRIKGTITPAKPVPANLSLSERRTIRLGRGLRGSRGGLCRDRRGLLGLG